jgi:hypothetical protein
MTTSASAELIVINNVQIKSSSQSIAGTLRAPKSSLPAMAIVPLARGALTITPSQAFGSALVELFPLLWVRLRTTGFSNSRYPVDRYQLSGRENPMPLFVLEPPVQFVHHYNGPVIERVLLSEARKACGRAFRLRLDQQWRLSRHNPAQWAGARSRRLLPARSRALQWLGSLALQRDAARRPRDC